MSKETPRFKIPYPSENQDNYYGTFLSGFTSIDGSTFATFEARNNILFGGSTIKWVEKEDEGGAITWHLTTSAVITAMTPTYGQGVRLPVIGDTENPTDGLEIPAGNWLIVDMPRGPVSGVDLPEGSLTVATQLDVNNVATALAYHDPDTNKLIWCTGLVLYPNSETNTGIHPITEIVPGGGSNAEAIQGIPVCDEQPTEGNKYLVWSQPDPFDL